jgi:uncharacterized protein (TIGR00369 family)
MSGPQATEGSDRRHAVAEYLRLERWEVPSPPEHDGPPSLRGRLPVDAHQRGGRDGLRAGSLVTAIDSLGGFLCGLAVQPQWIVTTSVMATLSQTAHVGPLRLEGRVLRRGRNAVVAAVDVFDEGAGDGAVGAATMTCAVLDPGDMDVHVERPFGRPMPPFDPAAPPVEEFFGIAPGAGTETRLDLADRLRNPWGILHGGGLAVLADVAACRAVTALDGHRPDRPVTAADTVLHFLRPARVGPVEARCQILGDGIGRALVRVAIHDRGAGDRLVTLGSVLVLTD